MVEVRVGVDHPAQLFRPQADPDGVAGPAVGGVAANVSLAIAVIRSVQEAAVSLPSGTASAATVSVTSEQNTTNDTTGGIFGSFTLTGTGTDDRDVAFHSMAEAFIFSASAGCVSINANMAVAVADAKGTALLDAAHLTSGAISVVSNGSSIANIVIDNLTIAAVSVGVMVGCATAAGEFTAAVVSRGSIVSSGDLTVHTNYSSIANAEIVPAAAGVSLAMTNIGVNLALSVACTKANASITGSVSSNTVEALSLIHI
jgi:hypothetical protein